MGQRTGVGVTSLASGVMALPHQLMGAHCEVFRNFTSCLLNSVIFEISYGGGIYTTKISNCHKLKLPSVYLTYQHITVSEFQSLQTYEAGRGVEGGRQPPHNSGF